MADMSQVEAPEATGQETSAATETPRLTPDEIRDKIRGGEVKSQDQLAELIKNVKTEDGEEQPPATPEPQPEKPEPKAEPSVFDKPSKDWTAEDMMAAIKTKGFSHKNPYEFVESASTQQEVLNRYKKEAREKSALLEEAKRIQENLEKQLQERVVTPSPAPLPVSDPDVEVPNVPDMPSWDSADESEVKAYEDKVKDVLSKTAQKASQETKKAIEEIRQEFDTKIKEANAKADKATQDFADYKATNEQTLAAQQAQRDLDDAFSAVKRFQEKNPEWKMERPVEDVHKEFVGLYSEVEWLKTERPEFQGRDLIAEYIKGEDGVKKLFNGEAIRVSDDMKNYLFLSDLYQDAKRHAWNDVGGRPDLFRAFNDRKFTTGMSEQEVMDAKKDGFQSAQQLHQTVSKGVAEIPRDAPVTPEEKPPMTEQQLMDRLKEIKTLPPAEHKKALEELRPMMMKHFRQKG